MTLLARVIGGNQMFAPVLDPFNGFFESQGGRANEHILRVHFPANAEASADVALIELHLVRMPAEHERQPVSVPVRYLGGAVHLQNVVGFVVARNGATRLHRHAAVPADFEIKRHDHLCRAKGCIDVAGFLFDDGRFGVVVLVKRAWRSGGVENDRQRLDIKFYQVRRVLSDIGIGGEKRPPPVRRHIARTLRKCRLP